MDKKTKIAAGVLILIGILVLLYPTISNFLIQLNGSLAISSYDDAISELKQEEVDKIFSEAEQYNQRLGQMFDDSADQEGYGCLDVNDDGVMGYINIPKIHVNLPIYYGTDDSSLQKGVGHMKGSSLPVGGSGTHAILTGHRGLPDSDLFSDLDQLKEGDQFFINILGEVHAYQVDSMITVLPYEVSSLNIENGKDYVTLVTCTPYAVNTHRLLVRGIRTQYEEADRTWKERNELVSAMLWFPKEIKIAVAALGVIVFGCIIMSVLRRKK